MYQDNRELRRLVRALRQTNGQGQVAVLQEIGGKLINEYRVEAFGIDIRPLWVEAYDYDEERFPDLNTHRSVKQKDRFGRLYFHERGYGGVDLCLSDGEDIYLSFLLKATLVEGRFLTQTGLCHLPDWAGRTRADLERLDCVLVPGEERHTVCYTTRVDLARPCYSGEKLTAFALDALPQYDFRFGRRNLRENVREYLTDYLAGHPDCTPGECRAQCRRVFGWAPAFVSELAGGQRLAKGAKE